MDSINLLEEAKNLEKEIVELYSTSPKLSSDDIENIRNKISFLGNLRELRFFERSLEDDIKENEKK